MAVSVIVITKLVNIMIINCNTSFIVTNCYNDCDIVIITKSMFLIGFHSKTSILFESVKNRNLIEEDSIITFPQGFKQK